MSSLLAWDVVKEFKEDESIINDVNINITTPTGEHLADRKRSCKDIFSDYKNFVDVETILKIVDKEVNDENARKFAALAASLKRKKEMSFKVAKYLEVNTLPANFTEAKIEGELISSLDKAKLKEKCKKYIDLKTFQAFQTFQEYQWPCIGFAVSTILKNETMSPYKVIMAGPQPEEMEAMIKTKLNKFNLSQTSPSAEWKDKSAKIKADSINAISTAFVVRRNIGIQSERNPRDPDSDTTPCFTWDDRRIQANLNMTIFLDKYIYCDKKSNVINQKEVHTHYKKCQKSLFEAALGIKCDDAGMAIGDDNTEMSIDVVCSKIDEFTIKLFKGRVSSKLDVLENILERNNMTEENIRLLISTFIGRLRQDWIVDNDIWISTEYQNWKDHLNILVSLGTLLTVVQMVKWTPNTNIQNIVHKDQYQAKCDNFKCAFCFLPCGSTCEQAVYHCIECKSNTGDRVQIIKTNTNAKTGDVKIEEHWRFEKKASFLRKKRFIIDENKKIVILYE